MSTEQMMMLAIIKTTHATQSDLFRATDNAFSTHLKSILHSQQTELDVIESEFHSICCRRGWEMPAQSFIRIRLPFPDTDSRIAERLILIHTKSMINLLKLRGQYDLQDRRINSLLQKLLDCRQAGIRELLSIL